MRLFARLRALWRTITRSAELDAEMDEEMRFHVEMQADRLMHERGLNETEARRQAFVAFGGVEKFKEHGRDVRGLQWLDAVAQDVRLAGRMLIKYPALTLIGGFAMAVAIAIGATTFEIVSEALAPPPIIQDGDRLVAIQFATDAQGSPERRVLADFMEWREGLATIQQVSAFRTASHNLSIGDDSTDPIRVAEVTASAFDVSRVPPLLGRYIQAPDEVTGAAPVVVIGHAAWQTRFAGDPAIVGRIVKLDGASYTIAGVMPEGFKFPVDHEFWIPLRVDGFDRARLQGPSLWIFGRLAPGVTIAQAQAELTAIGRRLAGEFPEQYSRLRPTVMPYAREHVDIDRPEIVWLMRLLQLLVGGLLVIVSANLAILMYARTVTRQGEIALRSALGASRGRLLGQLFIEALALSLVGAAGGLFLAGLSLSWIEAILVPVSHVPYWIGFDLSPLTVGYAIALAIVAALIVGVLPGLRSTGRHTHTSLRAVGGSSGRPLGRLWTSLIVTQVAIASTILPLAIYFAFEVVRMEFSRPAFPAGEFVLAKVDDRTHQREIVSRLEGEPGIAAVTFSYGVPGFEGSRRIELDGETVAASFEVNTLDVDAQLFAAYDAKILAGRGFRTGDASTNAVIVNRTFAEQILNNTNVLGRRLSFPGKTPSGAAAGETLQVVGIVDDFPRFPPAPFAEGVRTMYRPAAIGDQRVAVLTIRYRTSITAETIERLRHVVASVDPAAPLRDVTLLTEFYRANRSPWRLLSIGLAVLTASVLLLSAAGIYALMSFTVAQRTREIGIRTALGANPRRILAGIFGRVLAQLAIGLGLGSLLSGALIMTTLTWQDAGVLFSAVAAVILAVGLAAALGPARRGLAIDPTEALRTDA